MTASSRILDLLYSTTVNLFVVLSYTETDCITVVYELLIYKPFSYCFALKEQKSVREWSKDSITKHKAREAALSLCTKLGYFALVLRYQKHIRGRLSRRIKKKSPGTRKKTVYKCVIFVYSGKERILIKSRLTKKLRWSQRWRDEDFVLKLNELAI